MRYGLPYQGSKNAIAEWLVCKFPKAETFVDLFCGGGAVTHCAMLSGKYKQFIMNDIDGRLPTLFKDCVYGKYTVDNHQEWVSREEFHRLKDKDAYIALVWSFGNNGKDYIYGKDLEAFKHDYHRAVFENNPQLLEKWGYKIDGIDTENIYDRYLFFNAQIKRIARSDLTNIESLQSLQYLQSLQNLDRLQGLHNLQSFGVDYQQVDIPDGALIYCDIPYRYTDCKKYKGFNHKRFYEWAEVQDNIFISEYSMPDCFIPYARIEKRVNYASNGNSAKATEMLFTNKRTFDRLNESQKEIAMLNFAEQTSLF